MVKPNLTVIEILWEGPLKIEDAKKKTDKDTDYGLYQVYGTHNIYGANTLLYIGKACEQELGNRILQHDSWTSIEQSELTIYFGRLGGTYEIDNKTWTDFIGNAETLLIYYCSPAYNSKSINSVGILKDLIVLNHGKKNLLPFEVSTLLLDSQYNEDSNWRIFGSK